MPRTSTAAGGTSPLLACQAEVPACEPSDSMVGWAGVDWTGENSQQEEFPDRLAAIPQRKAAAFSCSAQQACESAAMDCAQRQATVPGTPVRISRSASSTTLDKRPMSTCLWYTAFRRMAGDMNHRSIPKLRLNRLRSCADLEPIDRIDGSQD